MSKIHINPAHKGELHRDTGTPAGKPIPESKLQQAKHSSDPAERKRATFAENAKHWNHGGHHSGVESHISHHETHGHGSD